MKPIVYGIGGSQFTRKVRAFLAEKGVDYHLEPVMPMAPPPDYEKIHPMKQVPSYRDEHITLPDSSVICAYLEKKHPEPALYPADAADYGRALWLEEYADTALIRVVGLKIFMNKIVGPVFLGRPCNEDVLKEGMEKDLPPLLDYLQGWLEGGAEYLVGGAFGIADISVATQLATVDLCGESIDASRWPALTAWLDRVLARPSFKTLIDQDRAMLSQKKG